jgi:alpha-glucosidase
VERELAEPASTLHFYIEALAARRALQSREELAWLPSLPDVVAFERPGGWLSVTNFGEHPVPMPAGRLVIASRAVDRLELPAETTVWLQTRGA